MEITSYETAKRLKEAGFPQPEFKTAQFWYTQEGELKFTGKNSVIPGHFECHSIESGISVREYPVTRAVFYAPTATDILRELVDTAQFGFTSIGWIVADEYKTYVHENSAEAAALAWLDKNKNN